MMTLIRGDALDSQIPARTYIRRCARFGDRTVPFLVRSGDRTVLLLVLYPLQGREKCMCYIWVGNHHKKREYNGDDGAPGAEAAGPAGPCVAD